MLTTAVIKLSWYL